MAFTCSSPLLAPNSTEQDRTKHDRSIIRGDELGTTQCEERRVRCDECVLRERVHLIEEATGERGRGTPDPAVGGKFGKFQAHSCSTFPYPFLPNPTPTLPYPTLPCSTLPYCTLPTTKGTSLMPSRPLRMLEMMKYGSIFGACFWSSPPNRRSYRRERKGYPCPSCEGNGLNSRAHPTTTILRSIKTTTTQQQHAHAHLPTRHTISMNTYDLKQHNAIP